MIEGLFETWERRFEPEDGWPIIVMVLTDGGEISGYVSDSEYEEFVNDLIRRGATLHAVFFSRQGADSNTGQAQMQYAINLTSNTGGALSGDQRRDWIDRRPDRVRHRDEYPFRRGIESSSRYLKARATEGCRYKCPGVS